MLANTPRLICRYHYDALDRLIGTTSVNDEELRRFYCKKCLTTEIQGAARHSVFQQSDRLLAQHKQSGLAAEVSLLVTDQMRSVLQVAKANHISPIAYSPFGHRPTGGGLLSLLGFTGERADAITGHYLLGNGYRAFNPVLMRFNSPDSWCPFGSGGLNSYSYCLGDPVNNYDENGHGKTFLQSLFSIFQKKPQVAPKNGSNNKLNFKLFENLFGEDRFQSNQSVFRYYQKNPYSMDKKYIVPPRKIDTTADLKWIPDASKVIALTYYDSNDVNFILTSRNELFIGSSKHTVLSGVANSPDVITAGTIRRAGDNSFEISSKSGHFLPTGHSLTHVVEILKELGASATTKIAPGDTRLQRRIRQIKY